MPVLDDAEGTVYERYNLDKALLFVQRSATFLVDKEGIVRYVQRAVNPQASLDEEELLDAVERLDEAGGAAG